MKESVERRGAARVAVGALVGVVASGTVVVSLVLLSITDSANSAAAGYLPLAWAAAAVLLTVLLVSVFVRKIDVSLVPGFPWFVGIVSFVVSFLPWWGLSGGNPDLGTLMYRGLNVPQGIIQFWDLALVMQSVDCSRWGFDIYLANNGCLQDPSIYAPGMVWLQYVPFNIFSQANAPALGVAMILLSSLALMWLARQSAGLGQIALLVAAVGGPWLLLLERANIDAIVLWSAVVTVLVTRRWSGVTVTAHLWPWVLAAAVLWLMGTWKYYPFVLGVMLLPVLRLRHGWIVISGYLIAALAFIGLTWENFRFSSSANSGMVDFGDFVVLGRIPLVARMVGTDGGAGGIQVGDLLVFVLGLLALAWGAALARMLTREHTWSAMLATGGSALYLASVLVSGFGYGYKAAFLLLGVPLVSRFVSHCARVMAGSALAVLLLIGIQSMVVWNMVLVTTSGVIAAGFCLGLGGMLMMRPAIIGIFRGDNSSQSSKA